jgi:peptide methionine sulfoxide reductase msrA/msrB
MPRVCISSDRSSCAPAAAGAGAGAAPAKTAGWRRAGGVLQQALIAVVVLGAFMVVAWAVPLSGGRGTRAAAADGAPAGSHEQHHEQERTTMSQTPDARPAVPRKLSRSAHDITRLAPERIEALAEKLSPEQRRIVLAKGTERAFCGTLLENNLKGVYCCVLCGLPLFDSNAKFDSGTGWPSFFQPVDREHIRYEEDTSHGMRRTEIMCERCGGHLGHVFDDGPRPTGLRYCLNSESLVFYEHDQPLPEASQPVPTEAAYFAGGCFWGIEDYFQHKVPGVVSVVSGYQGGDLAHPDYRTVCTGVTGHAETIRIVYDPTQVSYQQLLEVFFRVHDPTTLNRQGPDVGTQYRSAIFAANDEQHELATRYIAHLQAEDPRFKKRRIVTEVNRFAPFWEAEPYHQDYYERNGGSCALPVWD